MSKKQNNIIERTMTKKQVTDFIEKFKDDTTIGTARMTKDTMVIIMAFEENEGGMEKIYKGFLDDEGVSNPLPKDFLLN